MKRIQIVHLTEYRYEAPVTLSPHRMYLRPRDGHDLRVESSLLAIEPAHRVHWVRDLNDNAVAFVSFDAPSDLLSVRSEVVVQQFSGEGPAYELDADAAVFPFQYHVMERPDLAPLATTIWLKDVSPLSRWLGAFWQPGRTLPTFDLLNALNAAITEQFEYTLRLDEGVQTPAETLERRAGSCRDFATLFIECCRVLGLAARFVSGYLHAPSTLYGGASTHAWAEVYLPGSGWVGFDPTVGTYAGEHHIAVAVHRHPEAIPPISGAFRGRADAPPTLTVDVTVRELADEAVVSVPVAESGDRVATPSGQTV